MVRLTNALRMIDLTFVVFRLSAVLTSFTYWQLCLVMLVWVNDLVVLIQLHSVLPVRECSFVFSYTVKAGSLVVIRILLLVNRKVILVIVTSSGSLVFSPKLYTFVYFQFPRRSHGQKSFTKHNFKGNSWLFCSFL